MDITPLTDRLSELITGVRREVDGGRVLVSDQPVDLDELILDIAPDFDSGEWISFQHRLREDLGFGTALEFEWGGGEGRAMSWFGELEYLELAGRAYVFAWFEPEVEFPWLALAAIEPADHRGAWSAFLRELLESNGTAFGVELFAELPGRFTNQAPDRIDEGALRRALEAWTLTYLPDER